MWLSAKEQELLHFATGDEIFEYIDRSQVPCYMGGKNGADFTVIPEGSKKYVEDLSEEYGFTREKAREYMKQFQPFIDEGKLLLTQTYNSRHILKEGEGEDVINNNVTNNK